MYLHKILDLIVTLDCVNYEILSTHLGSLSLLYMHMDGCGETVSSRSMLGLRSSVNVRDFKTRCCML